MLVLNRCAGETIVFSGADGETRVEILAVRDTGRVKIGVVAPKTVEVFRAELWERICAERRAEATEG